LDSESLQPKAAEEAAFGPPGVAWTAGPSSSPLHAGRLPAPTFPLTPAQVLALQRTGGNRAVNRVLSTMPHGRRVGRSLPRTFQVAKLDAARSPAVRLIQRANPADTRLPADKLEALAHADSAKVEILNALGTLAASPDVAKKNIPDLVTSGGLKLGPLTPRHDSALGAPKIKFFTGTGAYAGSFTTAETLTHHVPAVRTNVFIRARDHANVDTMLPGAQIADRIVQAMAEVSQTMAGPPGAPSRFEIYRGKFNGYWDVAPFAGQATEWNQGLDSRGPRSERARNIFQRIYSEDAAFATAYDANTARIKDRVDTYMGPDAMNVLNSPRVQALRARFYAHPTPVTSAAQYNALKADVQAGAAALQPEDREAISRSNQWRALIVDQATTAARRDELLAIITNQPAAPAAAAPVIPPVVAPVAAGPAQAFLDSVTIDAPVAPIAASGRTEAVTLTPKSPAANPGVVVDTRLTVTPAARVAGANVSPAAPFPPAALAGAPFVVDVRNTGNVVMNAKLELINNPAGLTAAVPAQANFTVNDNRRADFIANWSTALNFTKAGSFEFFDPAMPPVVQYIGGSQEFIMWTELSGGGTNPGLSFFSKVGIHRGAAKLAESTDAFPQDQARSPEFRPRVAAPAPVPALGDPLDFKYDLLDTDRTTVLSSKVIPVKVMPEAAYGQPAAIAAATADDTWMHGAGPAQLLGLLTAKGGRSAKLAAAIAPPNPIVELKPITIRHDSAAYVASAMGAPGQAAFFEGIAYGAFPDPNTRLDSPARPAYALPNRLFLNRTTDVATGAKRTDAEILTNAIHEGTHAVDEWDVRTPAEDYKSEFRAYWNEGRFGPPDVQLCLGAADCFDTTIDPTMPPPGPKSPRARKIFEHLYGSYAFARTAYDNDTDGFREMADNYTHPEGLNLSFSRGLDALQGQLRKYKPATFPALHTTVKGFMGTGAPPPTGVLTADEQTEIASQRSWGLLLNRVVTNAAHRTSLKTTLKIP
jgi:hypothetical protein